MKTCGTITRQHATSSYRSIGGLETELRRFRRLRCTTEILQPRTLGDAERASASDLYAGAINLHKCSINSSNSACSTTPFLNLKHVYGCNPLGAPAHVHPDQHALAYTIPASGTDLMYFANDGGIYRSLDGYTGLASGSCSGTNQFDDLNQHLGSMTQFVSTDPRTN